MPMWKQNRNTSGRTRMRTNCPSTMPMSAGATAAAEEVLASLAAEVRACAPEERQAKIQAFLEHVVKQTLRLDTVERVDPDQGFVELGVDSLMAMEVRNRLQPILAGTGRSLTIDALQENRTLRKLSTVFLLVLSNAIF